MELGIGAIGTHFFNHATSWQQSRVILPVGNVADLTFTLGDVYRVSKSSICRRSTRPISPASTIGRQLTAGRSLSKSAFHISSCNWTRSR